MPTGQHNNHRKGPEHPMWKGGIYHHSKGYIYILKPNHPKADCNGYVLESYLLAEKALGKPLPPTAVVHHANGSKINGQLVICENIAYHNLLHRRMRAYEACGHANWRKCPFCKQWDDPKNMYVLDKPEHAARHRECANEYKRRRKSMIT